MAKDFRNRSVVLDLAESYFNGEMISIAENAIQENAVTSLDSLVIYSFIIKNQIKKGIFNRFIHGFDYHISEKGFGTKPYFLWIAPRASHTLKIKLDFMSVK